MEHGSLTKRGEATRQRIADAAIQVLGAGGARALTHARVDAVAGLPRGSTSNHHRTRSALLTAAVSRLVAREQQLWDSLEASAAQAAAQAAGPVHPDLAALATRWVERAVTTEAALHLARYALCVESRGDQEALAVLRAGRQRVEAWVEAVLVGAGAAEPRIAVRLLLAHVDGVLFSLVTGLRAVEPGTWDEVHQDLVAVVGSVLARGAPGAPSSSPRAYRAG